MCLFICLIYAIGLALIWNKHLEKKRKSTKNAHGHNHYLACKLALPQQTRNRTSWCNLLTIIHVSQHTPVSFNASLSLRNNKCSLSTLRMEYNRRKKGSQGTGHMLYRYADNICKNQQRNSHNIGPLPIFFAFFFRVELPNI